MQRQGGSSHSAFVNLVVLSSLESGGYWQTLFHQDTAIDE